MQHEDPVLEIADLSIRAAMAPELWPELCDRISAAAGSPMMLFCYNVAEDRAAIFRCGADLTRRVQPVIAEFMSGGQSETDLELYRRLARLPRRVLHAEHLLAGCTADADLPDNPFRTKQLDATGGRSRAVMRLGDIGPWMDIVSVHPGTTSERIPPDLRSFVGGLGSLLSHSLETERVIHSLTRRYAIFLDMFDRLNFAAAFVRQDGTPIESNACFRDLAAEADGLCMIGGRVTGTDARAAARLGAALRRQTEPGPIARGVPAVLLDRRSGQRSLLARVVRVGGQDMAGGAFSDQAVALVVVLDPDSAQWLDATGLEALGVLTTSELEICGLLVEGVRPDEIAERRSTTIGTTRGQIKSASAKLACRSRVDLLRLAMATRAPLTDGGKN